MNTRLVAGVIVVALVGCKPGDGPDDGFVHSGTIGTDTWGDAIHVVDGDLMVNGVLTVEPCAEIRMDADTKISVSDGGALHWVGEEDCPIVVKSGKVVPGRGDWAGIELYETGSSDANEFQWVEIRHAGQGYGAIWMESGAGMSMRDTTIEQSGDYGLYLDGGAELDVFSANTLVDNAGPAVRVDADGVDQLGPGTYGPNDIDGIEVRGGYVSHDAIWADLGVPYRVIEGLDIASASGSAHLTVQAGAVLALSAGQGISVTTNGGLSLLGTATDPVTVTSIATSPAAGDWTYVELYSSSDAAANVFQHAVVEYGGDGYGAVWVDDGASLAMTDTVVRHSADVGVEVAGGGELRSFTGNTLVSNALGPVRIGAGEAHLLGAGTYGPNTRSAIDLQAGAVDHDVTWLALGVPYAAGEGFTVAGDGATAILTVAGGTTLQLGPDAIVAVRTGGALRLAGTSEHHVTVTSAAAVPAAGDWAEIDLHGTAGASTFTYADLQYGGAGGYGAVWVDEGTSLALDHVTFAHVLDCDVSGDGSVTAASTTWEQCL